MIIKFNVFGKKMVIERKGDSWLLFNDADVGIRSRIYDAVIPSGLSEAELTGYLADIYHEHAREDAPKVVRLN